MGKRKGRGARRQAAAQPKGVKVDVVTNDNTVEILDETKSHLVNVMADHQLQFPDLYLSVYVAGDTWEQRAFAALFSRSYCHRAASISEADLVVFTGGPDVDPQLYGERPHKSTRIHAERDDADIEVYMECLTEGIPMLGICRGAQFLHVMNGGKLYQDVENHNGNHKLFDAYTKEYIEKVSSVHHQAVMPKVGMRLIATAIGANCERRALNPTVELTGKQIDVEAFFYPDTLCFGVQGHPEYSGYNAFAKWTLDKINELFILNTDVEWQGKRRRLKADIMEQRNAGIAAVIEKNTPVQIGPVGEVKETK